MKVRILLSQLDRLTYGSSIKAIEEVRVSNGDIGEKRLVVNGFAVICSSRTRYSTRYYYGNAATETGD